MEQVLTALSGLAIAVGYTFFIVGIRKGSVVPNRASWIVWFAQDILMAISAIAADISPAVVVMPVVWGVGSGIVLFLSLKRGSYDSFTSLERTCLILGGIGIFLWATTGSPRLALVAGVSACCIGGIPTIIKSWVQPSSETPMGWVLMIVGTIFSSLAIKEWDFNSGLMPVAIGILQVTITLPLVLYVVGLWKDRPAR